MAQFKAVDLKKLLKDSSLMVSGRKQDLAERLANKAPGAAKKAAGNVVVLRCTEEGETMAKTFIAEQEQAKRKAQSTSLKSLQKKDFTEAARTMLAFTATEPFNRGSTGDTQHEVSELKAMFRHVPTILNEMPGQALQDLKVAAGMDVLWGTDGVSAWLPDDFETGISLGPDAAARMLIFYRKHLKDLQYFNRLKAKAVEIAPVLDVNCCDACRSFANKAYSMKTVPELPNPNCSCDLGCRCIYIYAG